MTPYHSNIERTLITSQPFVSGSFWRGRCVGPTSCYCSGEQPTPHTQTHTHTHTCISSSVRTLVDIMLSPAPRPQPDPNIDLVLTWTLKPGLSPKTDLWRGEDQTTCPISLSWSSQRYGLHFYSSFLFLYTTGQTHTHTHTHWHEGHDFYSDEPGIELTTQQSHMETILIQLGWICQKRNHELYSWDRVTALSASEQSAEPQTCSQTITCTGNSRSPGVKPSDWNLMSGLSHISKQMTAPVTYMWI